MSDRIYPVPWRLVFGLGPHIANGTQTSVDDFTRSICAQYDPKPLVTGQENLPPSARFLIVANHYQRKGLWILHPAAVITQAIRQHYGPGDPPVRWMVTANWPQVKIGPLRFRSPGDVLLPRVAHALACYPVSFAGSNQGLTAGTLRRVLRDARSTERPIGLFPEGVAGSAGKLTYALPGVDRLIRHLARAGMGILPVGILEGDSLTIRFGKAVDPGDLLAASDPAALSMSRVADLL